MLVPSLSPWPPPPASGNPSPRGPISVSSEQNLKSVSGGSPTQTPSKPSLEPPPNLSPSPQPLVKGSSSPFEVSGPGSSQCWLTSNASRVSASPSLQDSMLPTPDSAAIPPGSFHTTREAFATLELARAQRMGRRWSCRAFLPGLSFLTWQTHRLDLGDSQEREGSPSNRLKPRDRIRPPLRGEPSQRSARQRQSTAPCPAPALPREGDTEPRGAPGTEPRPGGAQEGQAGPNLPRLREGQGDEGMPLPRNGEGSRHPRNGGCCAGEGDAWLVPSRARRRLKVPSARPQGRPRSPARPDARPHRMWDAAEPRGYPRT